MEIGAAPLHPRALAAAARDGGRASLHPAAWARIRAGHETLERLAAGGAAIYGVSTGLGAAVDTLVVPDGGGAQRRVVLARMVGVGAAATDAQVRAAMLARLSGFAHGRSGVSPGVAAAYLGMLNAGVVPVMPLLGSVGQADLAPLAHVAAPLVGAGEAAWRGAVLPGAEALARAGIAAPPFGAKDGLALVSSNAASVGLAALVLAEAETLFGAWVAAAALSLEGFGANPAPLHPRATALRPAPGQGAVAGALLAMLDGGGAGTPRRLQDPLSFRCLAPVLGAALAALHAATSAVALELNASDDNPAVLAEHGCVQPNANFDPTHLALAFEGLGLAVARVAALQGARIVKLMSPGASGLPRFLSPVQAGRNGFATVQKTAGALVAEAGQHAMPLPACLLPAADGVEDYATMALGIVRKAGALLETMRLLCAIELLVAAQACDLRPGLRLGTGSAAAHAAVRAVVPMLGEDRPAAPDIQALAGLIAAGRFDGCTAALFDTPLPADADEAGGSFDAGMIGADAGLGSTDEVASIGFDAGVSGADAGFDSGIGGVMASAGGGVIGVGGG